MRKADIVSAALVVLFGAALLFYFIPVWTPVIVEGDFGLGARDMPTVAALVATGLAVLFLVSRIRGRAIRRSADESRDPEDDAASPISRGNARYLLYASAFLIAMVALFNYAGFLVAGPVTIVGFMFGMGERRWLHLLGTAVLATGAIWLFFWQLLRFPLP